MQLNVQLISEGLSRNSTEAPIGALSSVQQIHDFSVRTPCFKPTSSQILRQKLEKHVWRLQQQQIFG
eukprot:SAG31_NODE_39196_length_290_cov_0.811518_1_plen_66_part_01